MGERRCQRAADGSCRCQVGDDQRRRELKTISDATVRYTIANPLTSSLAHYVDELTDVITAAGHAVTVDSRYPCIEGTPALRKPTTALALVAAQRRLGRDADNATIVIWPGFGRLEATTWSLTRPRGDVFIIFHDISPLSRSHGHGPIARFVSRALPMSSRVSFIVHGEHAAGELRQSFGAEPTVARHPVLGARRPHVERSNRVLVIGQNKQTRERRSA